MRVSGVVRVDTFCRQTSRDHSQAFPSTAPKIWGFCFSGVQDNEVLGALQGERLWITCGYFVSEWGVFAVALAARGLHTFSASCSNRADFYDFTPYRKIETPQGYLC